MVAELTRLLRSSQEPLWARLREELTSRGLEPSQVALAVSHEDDEDFEYGVVVSPEGGVYEFGFSYLGRSTEEGEIVEWNNISARWADGWYHRSEVEQAIKFLSQ